MKIYACSTNPGKLQEFALGARLASVEGLVIEPFPHLKNIGPPEESGATFEENASAKALYYSDFTTELVFADDSGLEVEALGGAPGVRSARYAGPDSTDASNNALLLKNLKDSANRKARFVCVLAMARTGKILVIRRGVVEGEILSGPRGDRGFGYDPLFFYPLRGQSFGELTAQQKFSVSHRGQALRELLEWLAHSYDL